MIEFMPESTGPVVGIRATGTLTPADYQDLLIPQLDRLFEQYGKLRMLFYMDEAFSGWQLSAAREDAVFGLRHRADFDKIAVVGGPHWVAWCIRFTAFLIAGEIRTFSADRLQDAWTWLKAI
jgi:SpoIIAA-like